MTVSYQFNHRLKLTKRVMMFVDGGYVRKQMENNLKDTVFLGDEEKSMIEANLQAIFGKACEKFFPTTLADLIRIYYYDGTSDDQKHKNVRIYHDKLKEMNMVHVKTIQMAKSSKEKTGYKQKGIDTLISIDMLSKAYENHYDVAFLLAGDRDFEPVVKAVKDDAGKNVYGIYFDSSFSYDLKISFDSVFEIIKTEVLSLLM